MQPSDRDVHVAEALELCRRRGGLTQALQEAVALAPQQGEWVRELAGAYCREGRPLEAVALLGQALTLGRDWRTLRLLGIAQRQAGQLEAAQAALEDALAAIDPVQSEARQEVALLLLRHDRAHETAKAVLGSRAVDGRVRWLAREGILADAEAGAVAEVELLLRMGLPEDALAAARALAAQAPQSRAAWDWVKRLCTVLGDDAGAAQALLAAAETAVAAGDEASAEADLGLLQGFLGEVEPEPIMQIVAAAIDALPDDALEDAMGRLSSAGEVYAGQSPQAHYNLAVAYLDMELHASALREFEQACVAPELYGDSVAHLCACLLQLERRSEALELLQDSLRQLGRAEGIVLRVRAAQAFVAAGERGTAWWLCRDVLRSDPRNTAAQRCLAELRDPMPLQEELEPILAHKVHRTRGRVAYV
jgi:tetratricopeptide (TPR) repeat protein